MLIIALILLTLLLTASGLLKNIKVISYINIIGMLISAVLILLLSIYIYKNGSVSIMNDILHIDSLSAVNLLIIGAVSLIAVIYSHTYIANEVYMDIISPNRARLYYVLFDLFVASMVFVCISNNIVAMWIALEATTLSTAFLISFDKTKLALEAAWKYVIICSIGIGLGLIGIILIVYSSGSEANHIILNWTYLMNNYHILDPRLFEIAFVFIFIGIGTKAGLAPMHTWLPDGHSEAPAPISAMMSGILLNLAFYVILRFYILAKNIENTAYLKYFFIVFGCISLIIASFSILRQKNYKRLLAFSSIENIGIISIGIGFGGYLGVFGALLHSVIHALGKTLLFLISGNILHIYKTKRIDKISGMIYKLPIHSILLILGILIITGAPPFAAFFSEFDILISGYVSGLYIPLLIYCLALLLVFAAFINIFSKMIFVAAKENTENIKSPQDKENLVPLIITLILIIGTSIYFGGYLTELINKAAAIIG